MDTKPKRNAEICASFLAGKTPVELAQRFQVSPQRIRYILGSQGLRCDSTRQKRFVGVAEATLEARSAKWQKRFGISLAQREAILSKYGTEPFALYRQWKRNREHTGFVGEMPFADWWRLVQPWGRFQRDNLAIVRARFNEPFSATNCKVAKLGAHVVAVRKHHSSPSHSRGTDSSEAAKRDESSSLDVMKA